ncbi:septum formation protein Maf [Legionella israelensis]|uniref:Maf family protein n=1 Tax=Legionella israelensis TaxID=454 RepID=UPI001180EA11|nr:Maf family protein [Legionella israelensis]QDP73227.1 septum formation protein Maf [Legionella israelensis]
MSDFLQQKPLILASGSKIRNKLLQSTGLKFEITPSNCNEALIKQDFTSKNWTDLGYLLASHKAFEVSQRFPEHYIIAADQLCVMDNLLFDKPLDHFTAVNHLKQLQGKTHQQIACLCIVQKGKVLWQSHDISTLRMRTLNDRAIELYLKKEKPYHSCGAYQYETLGKWLFEDISGKEDTILGMPLMLLIKALLSLNIVWFTH